LSRDGGGRIHYRVAGRGVPILLIHAGLVDSRMWDEQVASLSPGHCTIRYDQRGFGRSRAPSATYSPVEDARAVLDKVGVSKVVVIGLSSGGQLAVDFALEHPDRVLALVTAAATVRGQSLEPVGDRPAIDKALKERGTAEAVRLWLEDPAFVTARDLPGVRERMRRMLTENVKAWGTPRPDLVRWPSRVPTDHLGEIGVPTLVVRGGQENPNIIAAADLLAGKIPRATLRIIPAAGHHLNMEAPEQFDAAVLSFLRASGIDGALDGGAAQPGAGACA
ncbi:MAG TPA: alpha/beta hydrolase, partial [Myxococcaceae bacterium]|nr:alpha/beta hydrolase [Myxococcaceae bacterium]